MSKSAIKFYLVPGIVVLIVVGIVLIIPFGKKKETSNPSPTSMIIIPTIILPTRTPFSTIRPETPTLIPIQTFTGADINQELPTDVKDIGIQKTTLRRQTPLTLEFGTLSFDYENDQFIVQLLDPTEQNKNQFITWLTANYPALTIDKFAFQ